jgi:hypothetical protein
VISRPDHLSQTTATPESYKCFGLSIAVERYEGNAIKLNVRGEVLARVEDYDEL